jgi:hypothetical protein
VSALRDLAQLGKRIKDKVRGKGRRKRDPLSHEVTHFIVSTGADLYLKMLLVDGLMHGQFSQPSTSAVPCPTTISDVDTYELRCQVPLSHLTTDDAVLSGCGRDSRPAPG